MTNAATKIGRDFLSPSRYKNGRVSMGSVSASKHIVTEIVLAGPSAFIASANGRLSVKVQINHWEPHRYSFCSYEDAKVIEVDEFIEIGTGRPETGCRFALIKNGVYIRDLDNGILSMLGGEIQVTGFREEVPEGAFYSGIFKREMWIKVPDDTEITEK